MHCFLKKISAHPCTPPTLVSDIVQRVLSHAGLCLLQCMSVECSNQLEVGVASARECVVLASFPDCYKQTVWEWDYRSRPVASFPGSPRTRMYISPHAKVQFRILERRSLGMRLQGQQYMQTWKKPLTVLTGKWSWNNVQDFDRVRGGGNIDETDVKGVKCQQVQNLNPSRLVLVSAALAFCSL